jgi:2-polyprenyl-3-methyl-5-hydroxy-6-metoxy-1,4-benzoquinol methylase
MHRGDERQGTDQVGRDPAENGPFAQGLEDQAPMVVLQVSETAMDEATRARAGAGREVVLLDQHRAKSPQGRIAKNAGAGDAAADHQEIELPCRKVPDRGAHRGQHITTADPFPRPSTWFVWHEHLITRGTRVLDLACGAGRHALAAAALGAEVTAVDLDAARLEAGRQAARERNLSVSWMEWDLTKPLPPLGTFDVVLIFNYLDRPRTRDLLGFLRPGGTLVMETFLEDQRAFEWGPTSDTHLLQRGELPTLVAPLQVLFGREVIEPVGGVEWTALASVVARKAN